MNTLALIAAAAALMVFMLPAQAAWAPDFYSDSGKDSPDEPDQLPDLFDRAGQVFDLSTYSVSLGTSLGASTADANIRAFLDAIAWAEGTSGPDGYRTMFTGKLFDSFADHPRIVNVGTLKGRAIHSSAAGRYQFIRATWDALQRRLSLPDFSPASQDAAAIELIRERGALQDVAAGRFADAVNKVRKVWASLPGAGYDQPEKPINQLAAVFTQSGGTLA